MMSYRIVVSYSTEKQAFVAQAPELESCVAEGATRAEAMAKLEEEMAAQVENMQAQGLEVPVPIDEQTVEGKLSLTVSQSLHRDLAFLAKVENVDLETVVVDLLTRGVSQRWGGRGGGGRPRGEGQRRPGEGQGARYHNIMENRADFIEYVRNLERQGQGGGGRGPGGGGGGGGGGRGPRGRR
jgi:predicted RNase H-like HicB family nuclease